VSAHDPRPTPARDQCVCGHYAPEHGPVVVRGRTIPRQRAGQKTTETVGEGCVWCPCERFRGGGEAP
jgi:hypothetical protein